jgi:hypothetical protein
MPISTYVADPTLDATADYLTDATTAITGLTADLEQGHVAVTPVNVASIRQSLAEMTKAMMALVTRIESDLSLKSGMN